MRPGAIAAHFFEVLHPLRMARPSHELSFQRGVVYGLFFCVIAFDLHMQPPARISTCTFVLVKEGFLVQKYKY
jgi:hypothetical protein